MSAPRPCVTNPFHPLGSASNNKSFLYTGYIKATSFNLQNSQFGSKIKIKKKKKTCEKRFFKHIRVVLCEKPLHKTTNIREMRGF